MFVTAPPPKKQVGEGEKKTGAHANGVINFLYCLKRSPSLIFEVFRRESHVVYKAMTLDSKRCPAARIITREDRKQSGRADDAPTGRWRGVHAASQHPNKSDENGGTRGCGLGRGFHDDSEGARGRMSN